MESSAVNLRWPRSYGTSVSRWQLSQNQMIGHMGLTDKILREEISDFERNKRIPPLEVILQYARAANVTVEALIDDEVTLPEKLPSRVKYDGIKRKSRFGKHSIVSVGGGI